LRAKEATAVLGVNVALGLLCISTGLLAFGKHPHM